MDEFDKEVSSNSKISTLSDDPPPSYTPLSERPEFYIIPTIFFCILVIGVLGNGTLVLVFSRHRNMRNVPNTYILSLALGDLFLVLTNIPVAMTLYTVEYWKFGLLMCKIFEMAKDVSVGVSIFTLTALSFERYCAISNPIRRKISSRPFTIATAVAIWFMAFILAMPAGYFSYLKEAQIGDEQNTTIQFCYPFPKELGRVNESSVIIIKFAIFYLIPLGVIACFYILMASHLWRTTRNMPGEMQRPNFQTKGRKKVAKMVLAFVILFLICYLPHHVYMLWYHLNPNTEQDYNSFWHYFRMVAFTFSFMHSCINPIALYFISCVFRQYYNRYLFHCFQNNDCSGSETSNRTQHLSCRRINSVMTHQVTLANSDHSLKRLFSSDKNVNNVTTKL